MTDVSAGFRAPCWCPSRWASAWRLHTSLHTNLYKSVENVSPHIFRKENCCDLNLGEAFAYLSYFNFQILDLIFWKVLIFYFDLFWMAWHWKPAILTQLLRLLTKTNIYTHIIYNISCSVWLIPSLTLYKGLHYLYYLQCGTYTTYNTIRSLTVLTIQMLTW